MGQKFKPGDTVRQIVPAPVQGILVGYALDQETGDVQFHVAWKEKDEKGVVHVHTRYFAEDQIEKIKDAPAKDAELTETKEPA